MHYTQEWGKSPDPSAMIILNPASPRVNTSQNVKLVARQHIIAEAALARDTVNNITAGSSTWDALFAVCTLGYLRSMIVLPPYLY